jgi:hypothetical protein
MARLAWVSPLHFPLSREVFFHLPPRGALYTFQIGLGYPPQPLKRDPSILPLGASHPADDCAALVIGGSNADGLANSATTLGIVGETITTGWWILKTSAVTTILPLVEVFYTSMRADAPVTSYCLGNSSFCCANIGGQLLPIWRRAGSMSLVRSWSSMR